MISILQQWGISSGVERLLSITSANLHEVMGSIPIFSILFKKNVLDVCPCVFDSDMLSPLFTIVGKQSIKTSYFYMGIG